VPVLAAVSVRVGSAAYAAVDVVAASPDAARTTATKRDLAVTDTLPSPRRTAVPPRLKD
jgi:hypothetical protein